MKGKRGSKTISAAYIAITAASTFFFVFREKLRRKDGGGGGDLLEWSEIRQARQRRWL